MSKPVRNLLLTFALLLIATPALAQISLDLNTQGFPVNQSISYGNLGGVWSNVGFAGLTITSGSLPPGTSLQAEDWTESDGEYYYNEFLTGTPTTVGNYTITFQATDGSNTPVSQTITINIGHDMNLPTTLPAATRGVPYSVSISGSGGDGTIQLNWYSYDNENPLPPGLSLSGTVISNGYQDETLSGASLTGTPSATGTYTFSFSYSDEYYGASSTLSLTIKAATMSITTASPLPYAVVGSPYSTTIAFSGGASPFTWAVTSGSLPAGLTLNTSTGAISGTPTSAALGTSTFTIQASDNWGDAATATFNLSTYNPVLITTTSLPSGLQSTAYTQSLTATGGTSPYTWTVTTGSLPPGLSINNTFSEITGTPTTAGTYPFTLTATDTNGIAASQALSIRIIGPLTITTSSPLPAGFLSTAYSTSLSATGGTSPYTWSLAAGSPPTGLTLLTNGTISGTPSSTGNTSFSVKVTDSTTPTTLTITASYSISIEGPISITTTTLPNPTLNVAYSQTLSATGGSGTYTWAVTSGGLPPGLTLSTAGVISGTSTASGGASFTVTVTDTTTPTPLTASQAYTLTIPGPLTITTSSLPSPVLGTSYNCSLSASGGVSPYRWTIYSGSLPSGLSLSQAGNITGTPVATGNFTITFQVTDSTTPTALTTTRVLSMTTSGQLVISTTSPPQPSVGQAYSTSLSATGGNPPYGWTINSGSLPPGITLGSTGTLSGTPTTAGTYLFTVTVTDSTADTTNKAFSLTVPGPLLISNATLPSGVISHGYSQTLAASGGTSPYTWSIINNSVPTGLTLNASSGTISGTPSAAGSASFTVQATDSTTPTAQIATANLSITITAPLSITTTSLPIPSKGVAYSASLTATGGSAPYTWSISTGSLPPGLTVNGTGTISGTPTTAGSYSFTVSVTDSGTPAQNATLSLSLTVPAALTVSTTSLPSAVLSHTYSQTLAATGGTTPYTWSFTIGSLPAGLTLNPTNGMISGTPNTAGSATFTVQVTDSTTSTAQTATANLSISVIAPLSITTTALPNPSKGAVYSASLAATGGTTPYTWAVSSGSLPPGLTLNGTGTISGTPTTAGSYSFVVTVTDSSTPAQTATLSLSLIVPTSLIVTTTSLPNAITTLSYTQTLGAAGGASPYTWAITTGSLPPGLTLNAAAGTISGMPTTTGALTFTVQVTDSTTPTAQTATTTLTITVNAPLTIATTTLPQAAPSHTYTTSLAATGGTTPYTWTLPSGTLPAGLTLATNGTLSGTPTSNGTFTFTVQVTDFATPFPQTATKLLTLTVVTPVTITTTYLPIGTTGTPYSQSLAASGGASPYTWSVSSGVLPAGLTLGTDGTITGTPTTTGSVPFTVQVTDNLTQTASQQFTVTIGTQFLILTSTLPSGLNLVPYNLTLSATGGTSPYTWSVTAGSLPAGLTLSPRGSITGLPTTTATSTFTVTATDSTQPTAYTATAPLSITINAAFQITTQQLPSGTATLPYSQTLAATGGTSPYTWSITSGTLPSGLSLTPAGTISGSPTTATTANLTIQATDSSSPTQSATTNLTLVINPVLTVTTATLPAAPLGVFYTQALAAAGGVPPYAWSISSGNLPPGLSLTNSGTISGIPLNTGTSTFTLQGTDATTPTKQTASQSFTISVAQGVAIATHSLPDGYVSSPYSAQLTAAGASPPYTWSATATSLPPGLTLNNSGYLAGTPTTPGTYPIAISVHDASIPPYSTSTTIAITIYTGLAITTTNLAQPQVNFVYTQLLNALNGTFPYTWTITSGSLPPGLALGANGVITGTPLTQGSATFTIQVTDSATTPQTATKTFTLTVGAGFSITTTSLPTGTPGSPYTATLNATGGTPPYTWTLAAGTIPTGLTLNPSGTLSGTPTTTGTYSFSVQAADSASPPNTATRLFSIPIGQSLQISTPSLPDGTLGVFYHQTVIATQGTAPYTYVVSDGTLPPGLALLGDGDIVGQPTQLGPFTFTVTALDSALPANSAAQTFTVTVDNGFAITTDTLPPGSPGVPYFLTLAANNGTTPYTWAITLGQLPNGMTLNSQTGVLSGTPTTPGLFNLIIQATDSSTLTAQTTNRQFTLDIDTNLQISTAILADAHTGQTYYQALSAIDGIPPYSWTVATDVPPGISFLTTGELYGIPTTPGQYQIAFVVSDNSQPVALASRNLTLLVTQALSITTSTLPSGLTTQPYATMISAAGGTTPYSFTLSNGALPTGLTLSPLGVLSGTPTKPGSFPITITASDASSNTATATFTLAIGQALTITTTSLPTVVTGSPYFALISATGGNGPYTWTLDPPPPGLSALPSLPAYLGAPTTPGTSTLHVSVTDGTAVATAALTLTVTAPLAITTTTLPAAQDNAQYSTNLTATGGAPPYSWSLAQTPTPLPGLTVTKTGTLTGLTTASPGPYPMSFCVTDSATPKPTITCSTFTLALGPSFAITPVQLPAIAINQSLTMLLTAVANTGNVTWTSAFPLPAGLALSLGGLLSGAPTNPGSTTITVIASDAAGHIAVLDIPLTVNNALSIANAQLPTAIVGHQYAAALLAANGTAPYTWTVDPTTLPPHFSYDPSGIIYGNPIAPANTTVSITVTDQSSPPQTATAQLSLTIAVGVSITSTNPPSATVGLPYTAALTAAGTEPFTWTLTSGTLPPGLSLATDGTISGTPADAGQYAIVTTVTDANLQVASTSLLLTVSPALSLPKGDSTLPGATLGQAYSEQLNSSSSASWTLFLGTLPPGLTLTPAGVLSGTPTAPGTTSFMLEASNSSQNAYQVYSLTVTTPAAQSTTTTPTIPPTSTQLPAGNMAAPYAANLTATGGTPPYAWSITQGSLPTGLTLNPSGTISGSPTASGTFTFALTVADASNQIATALYTLTVQSQLTFTSPSIVSALVGAPVTFALTATGGTPPYTWTLPTGSILPPGLTLSTTGSASISGTPTAASNTPLTLTLSDSATPPNTVAVALQFQITTGATITTLTLPAATRTVPYSTTLAASGGTPPYSWIVSDGQLPTGLTLTAGGIISGTSTADGTARFAITATAANGQTATLSYALTVTDPLAITPLAPLTTTVGHPTSYTLIATGGAQPYTWSIVSGTLPTGLSLAAATISGTPTAAASATLTVQVTDSTTPTPQTLTANLSIIITSPLTVATTTLPTAYQNASYSATLAASGGLAPYSWTISSGSLAPGITLAADGLLTGRPTSTGSFQFTVTAADSNHQQTTANLTCTVKSLGISTSFLPSGTAGTPYTAVLNAAGGLPPYSWTLTGTMPQGLTFTPDGVITGTPAATFSQPLTFTVTDQSNSTASVTITLTIGLPSLGALQITGLPTQLQPATQTAITVTLPQPAPTSLTGSLSISFTPTVNGRDDQWLTFVPANSRTLTFTVQEGNTKPTFSQTPILQAGTSAGTVLLTASLDNVTSSTATASTVIPQLAPVITSGQLLSHDQYTVSIQLDGYSTTTAVSSAQFTFPGLDQPSLTLNVSDLFAAWYSSAPALNQGGTFTYTQAFTFTGDSSQLQNITATLTNAIGSSTTYSITVP